MRLRSSGGFTPDRLVSALLGQRSSASPQVVDFLKRYGHLFVNHIQVFREPLPTTYETLLQMLTFGEWQVAKQKAGFKNMFHVGLYITLSNGQIITLEKRPTLKISTLTHDDSNYNNREIMYVVTWLLKRQIPLEKFIMFPAMYYGGKRFWDYDVKSNNCQDWVNMILEYWKLLTPQTVAFVKQSTDIVLNHPINLFVAHQVSKNAAKADILIHGCNGPTCLSTISNQFNPNIHHS